MAATISTQLAPLVEAFGAPLMAFVLGQTPDQVASLAGGHAELPTHLSALWVEVFQVLTALRSQGAFRDVPPHVGLSVRPARTPSSTRLAT